MNVPIKHIAAIIPAAGFSQRMGSPKALLPLQGRMAVEWAVAVFQEAGVEEIIVVTGHEAAAVGPRALAAGARTTHNPVHANGMFSSVQTGVAALSPAAYGFFLLPVDIPLVRPLTLRMLAAEFERHPTSVIQPCHAGSTGHPPLIPAALSPAILAWRGGHGLRGCLSANAESVRKVAVPDRFILLDMDTPEDYLYLQAQC